MPTPRVSRSCAAARSRCADGSEVPKGGIADTDELQLEGLFVYRTLVLRRSPEQSRPPSPYQLVDSGEFWEVWQRPALPPPAGISAPDARYRLSPDGYGSLR